MKRSFGWFGPLISLGVFVVLSGLERLRPLRRRKETKSHRELRNLAIAAVSGLAQLAAVAPILPALTRVTKNRRWGFLPLVRFSPALETAVALVVLDYSYYLWHVALHKIPFLWRFHVVHHADLDLDASTALRFHFGESLLSVPFQAAQITFIGVTPKTYAIWQNLFFINVLFHHSGLRLPIALERSLNLFLVTPRMHGIHHSIVQREADSNWSSGLNIWDRLHGTLCLNVPQQEVIVGVPAYQTPWSVRLWRMLRVPFLKTRNEWLLDDGTSPSRQTTDTPVNLLLP